ncbi:hypothetical protein HHK36_010671 [Tetracentron sinense]|uniref:MCAfunc domain-containing protein n=1 Tax=Tetracentron sinense TaxID=13715 RepID=A0A834Z7T9_TETSI|nr:hypothetical protein HHK36_010671 [Tetracentron sinense]
MPNLAHTAGVSALRLISMIVTAAHNATMHRKNCDQIAGHVKIIGNLLEKLNSPDLRNFPATGEPLDRLEEALRKALDLVESCREKSYLYLLSMGWSVVYQFRQAQAEIDRYLKMVPLISLVHEYRMQERLQAIEEDYREYTIDDEDVEAQKSILKSDRTKEDANILEKSLSRRYPDLHFEEALQEENEKLHIELQRSQVDNDIRQCKVIQHLIEVTESAVNVPPEKNQCRTLQIYTGSGYESTTKSSHVSHDLQSEEQGKFEWQTDLFDCCGKPCLSLKTCFYPCGTFVLIANAVSDGKISREHACNDLMAYSLVCGCCCYTCFMRQKLRELFRIEGGSCDDFLTHLMCCCCALVQEWREIELRGYDGYQGNKMTPPLSQDMER